jgi:hypothetical protein
MASKGDIKEQMEVIGADGVHVGTVDRVEGSRLKLTKSDGAPGRHQGHHHYLPVSLVANVEGNRVRLSATGANAFMLQEEEDQGSARLVTSGAPQSTAKPRREPLTKAPTWIGVALGAATLSAAGAALYARSRKTDAQRFELQLQTDENIRLISSTKVEGTPVVGREGEQLGRIESFMVDKYSGRVAYAVLSFGGTFGVGESLFPLPWSYLTYDVEKDGYTLNLTKEELATAPKFHPSEAPEFDTNYRQNLARAHSRSMI